ncbi:MAG: hypothetical protein ACI4ES_00610 [Roseburia sp.]
MEQLLNGDAACAKSIIQEEYPHCPPAAKEKRHYTEKQKLEQFVKDGFIDRYSGKRLLNSGILKVIFIIFQKNFRISNTGRVPRQHLLIFQGS